MLEQESTKLVYIRYEKRRYQRYANMYEPHSTNHQWHVMTDETKALFRLECEVSYIPEMIEKKSFFTALVYEIFSDQDYSGVNRYSKLFFNRINPIGDIVDSICVLDAQFFIIDKKDVLSKMLFTWRELDGEPASLANLSSN